MAAGDGKRVKVHGNRGFTLLEVLVAFIIAALAMSELFSVAASDLRAVAVAGRYEEALARARSHLAAAGVDGVLIPGEQQGDDGGGYHWSTRITEVAAAALPPAPATSLGAPPLIPSALTTPPPLRPALYAVAVAISWQEGDRQRVVRLGTERVGAAPAPQP